IGLANIGVEAVIRDLAPRWAQMAAPVIVNINGESIHEYVQLATALDGIDGVAGLELNISCPNVREGGMAFGRDPQMAAEVTRSVRVASKLPLIAKLTPNTADL